MFIIVGAEKQHCLNKLV